jgi:hypothetical protein
MKKIYFQAVCLLATLVGAEKASAQVTLSDFKVDNATAINVYSGMGTTRRASFTLKMTRAVNTAAPVFTPTLYLVGGNFPEQPANSVSITTQPYWSYDSATGQYVATMAGTFPLGYSDVAGRLHTGVQVVLSNNSSRSNTVGITEVTPPDYAQKPPITITNFQVNGTTAAVDVSAKARTVTYSMTLAKDPGFTDDFKVLIQGVTYNGVIDITAASVGTSSSNDWAFTGTKRTYAFSFNAPLSTSNLSGNDDRLTAQAGSYANALLGSAGTYVRINRVAIPCATDIYVQNNSNLTGTTTSGKGLYAGYAVTSSANGGVIVRNGATAALVAREIIDLRDGFSVEAGATFQAYIDGGVCSTGRYAADSASQAEASVATATAERLMAPTGPKAVAAGELAADAQDLKLAIYPNPAQNKLTISLPHIGDEARQVAIYNAQGAQVYRALLATTQQEIDVQSLSTGIYYLQVSQQGKTLKTSFTVAR